MQAHIELVLHQKTSLGYQWPMTVEEALVTIELILGKKSLNKVQEMIFRQSWEEKTYPEIAESYDYDAEYIKFAAFQLWKMLSEALGERVNKNNFRLVLNKLYSQNISERDLHSLSHTLDKQQVISEEGITKVKLSEDDGNILRRKSVSLYSRINSETSQYAIKPLIAEDNLRKTTSVSNYSIESCQFWGEAIQLSIFYGRFKELTNLEKWIVKEGCQLIAIVGMGGTGKTALSLKLASQIQDKFEYIVWRSVHNAPSLSSLLKDIIQFLSNQQEIILSEDVNKLIFHLLYYLQKCRCLIVLDNVESILCSPAPSESLYRCKAGNYREGYKDYGEFFKWIGELSHNSCLVLTSREKPKEVAALEGKTLPVKSLQLFGLTVREGKEIFLAKGDFTGSASDWQTLIQSYMGNPLALKIVATTINDLFAGNISKFLSQGTIIYGEIEDLLDQQFERLSLLEKEIMYWLAINREPVTLRDLQDDLLTTVLPAQLIEALESLERRCVLERLFIPQIENFSLTYFTLHSVLMEYLTAKLIKQVIHEIQTQKISIYKTHALIKAQGKDYIQEIQRQLIQKPLLNQLLHIFGNPGAIKNQIMQIILFLQENLPTEIGYAGGNTLNLLCQLQDDLSNHNFSNMPIWQADLRNVNLRGVDFSKSNLSKSTFTESFSYIYSLAISPDGRLIATGNAHGEICLRQMSNGQVILTWEAHMGWVLCLTFSTDGQMLISGSDDQTIKVWDINNGQCQQTLFTNMWTTTLISSHQILVSGSADPIVKVWDINNGECLHTLQGHKGWIWSVVLSSEGQTLASCSADRKIKLWKVDTGECLKTLQGHEDIVCSVVFTHDGQTLISGSSDRTVRLWDVQTGKCLKILQGHTDSVWSVALVMERSGVSEAKPKALASTKEIRMLQETYSSADHPLLASGSADRTIKLWDISIGQVVRTLQGHSYGVNTVVFSPDGQSLISKDVSQTIKLWNTQTGQCLQTFKGYTSGVWSIAFSPNGQTVIGSGEDQMVKLWDVRTGQCLKVLKGHKNWVTSVAFSPDGQTVATCGADRLVMLWDVHTGQCLRIFEGHTHGVLRVIYSPNGNTLASCDEDQMIRFWDIKTGECVQVLKGHISLVTSIVYSLDGQTFASSGTDLRILIWDVKTSQCLRVLEGHTNWVWTIVFHPNGQTVASCGEDHLVKIWDVNTGQCLKVLQGHTNSVVTVAYSPDGRFLASGGTDQTIRIWDVSTGQCLKVLKGHTKRVYSLAFTILCEVVSSEVDTVLASSSEDQSIRFWDFETGLCLKILRIRPYEGMNITGVTGITEAQKATLKALGAVEDSELPLT
ncbi:NB-ARC domain-containing protein [Nostoc sp. PCC 9305]|uniref:WD40 domain-containing protein n=1 Tax=Nostoc sp. PCC 9305 TaxID=296636 RepID=UPI0039C71F64